MTDDRFQELCQALLTVSFPGVRCFRCGQADGGRDAALAREGIVFQVKWTRYPERIHDPVRWLADTVYRERPKIARLHGLRARRYILMTNVRGTAALESGQIDRLDSALAEMLKDLPGLEVDVWWRDTLDRHLEPQIGLQAHYPEILSGRHVMGLALARRAGEAGTDEARRRMSESAVPVAKASARFLGVHPAVPGRGAGSERPAYVPGMRTLRSTPPWLPLRSVRGLRAARSAGRAPGRHGARMRPSGAGCLTGGSSTRTAEQMSPLTRCARLPHAGPAAGRLASWRFRLPR